VARDVPEGLSNVQIAAVAAAIHFVALLLFVLAGMHLSLHPPIPAWANAWSSTRAASWPHLVFMTAGTAAAAHASGAIARAGIAVAARSVLRAHGAAAIVTAVARAAVALGREWRFLDARGYPRAIFDEAMLLFIPQLLLGAATAVILRALTRSARRVSSIAPPEHGRERQCAALAVFCYLLAWAVPAMPFLLRILRRQDLDLDRIAIWLIPVFTGSTTAWFTADAMARQPRAPLGIAFLSHAMGALGSFALTAAAAVLIDFRGSSASPMNYSYSLMRFAWFSGYIFAGYAVVQSVLGAVSGVLFWAVSRRLPTPAAPRSPRSAIASPPPA
jgi:hypothetical protein